MLNGNGLSGVSNCYVFKSRLQEYAQKAGITTPVYETVKEGPSHEPVFRSTVIVNGVRYDSLPGFFIRKAAEQSAAEVALLELMKSGDVAQCIPNPVHETGLCKNLLQEYAQKRNCPIPSYICKRDGSPNQSSFTCTVEIGGIRYIGGAARTKKEAEIKAARTALLAIQSTNLANASLAAGQLFTVIPGKRKTKEVEKFPETAKAVKPKKEKFKKKSTKRRFSRSKGRGNEDHAQNGQDNGNVPVAQGVDTATSVLVNTNFQTPVMPNTSDSQQVELPRVSMQSTQGMHTPLMPDISSAPGEQMDSMSRCQNTNFQTPVMPNTADSQQVELPRVAMQSTQDIHTPLMPDISSAPREQMDSMSQCQGPIQQITMLPGLSSPGEAVKFEGAGQGMQSEQQLTANGSPDSRTGDAGVQIDFPVQELQLDQSNGQMHLGCSASWE